MAKHFQFPDVSECGSDTVDMSCALDVPDPNTPESYLHETETGDLIRDAISGLTPKHQELLTLRFEDGLTLDEIAGVFGVSKSAVSQMLTVALERARISLSLMGIESRDALAPAA